MVAFEGTGSPISLEFVSYEISCGGDYATKF